jgi:hypothetical protein
VSNTTNNKQKLYKIGLVDKTKLKYHFLVSLSVNGEGETEGEVGEKRGSLKANS